MEKVVGECLPDATMSLARYVSASTGDVQNEDLMFSVSSPEDVFVVDEDIVAAPVFTRRTAQSYSPWLTYDPIPRPCALTRTSTGSRVTFLGISTISSKRDDPSSSILGNRGSSR